MLSQLYLYHVYKVLSSAVSLLNIMLSSVILAQEIEKEIEIALTPIGSLTPQPFPWGPILLGAIVSAVVVFFFLVLLPKVASRTVRFGGILVIALAILLPFTLYAQRLPTKTLLEAAPGAVPENVAVTEVAVDSFTVEWATKAEVIGMVKYGTAPDQLEFFALDEKGNIPTTSHRVKVKNLTSKTRYYFEVISGKLRFNDDGQPLEVETLPAP